MSSPGTGTARAVAFPVAPEVAFDYLADPRHRSAWQSSLRRVEDVRGDVAVGQSWTDVTVPGLRPRMETTALERPHRWTERGTWRFVSAELTLTFAATASGCDVTPTMRLSARGPAALLARAVQAVAPYAVGADLRTAARILGEGAGRA